MATKTKKKTNKPTTGEKVRINHKFTPTEKDERYQRLTRSLERIEEAEAQLKADSAKAKAGIKQLQSEARDLRNQLSNGYEEREVDALVEFDRKRGVKRYTRHCPGEEGHGEFIKTAAMSEEDYALLPMEVAPETPKAKEETKPAEEPPLQTDGAAQTS